MEDLKFFPIIVVRHPGIRQPNAFVPLAPVRTGEDGNLSCPNCGIEPLDLSPVIAKGAYRMGGKTIHFRVVCCEKCGQSFYYSADDAPDMLARSNTAIQIMHLVWR